MARSSATRLRCEGTTRRRQGGPASPPPTPVRQRGPERSRRLAEAHLQHRQLPRVVPIPLEGHGGTRRRSAVAMGSAHRPLPGPPSRRASRAHVDQWGERRLVAAGYDGSCSSPTRFRHGIRRTRDYGSQRPPRRARAGSGSGGAPRYGGGSGAPRGARGHLAGTGAALRRDGERRGGGEGQRAEPPAGTAPSLPSPSRPGPGPVPPPSHPAHTAVPVPILIPFLLSPSPSSPPVSLPSRPIPSHPIPVPIPMLFPFPSVFHPLPHPTPISIPQMEQIKRANRLYTSDTIFLKPTLLIPPPGCPTEAPMGSAPSDPTTPTPTTPASTPHPDLTASDFLRRLDADIGRSKAAVVEQRLRAG